jgi:hypothetical protein
MMAKLLSALVPKRPQPSRPASSPRGDARCAAEVAECTCPDFCERDHGND